MKNLIHGVQIFHSISIKYYIKAKTVLSSKLELAKNQKGQSIIEFVFLFVIIFGFSFVYTLIIGDKFLMPYWKAIVTLVIDDPTVTVDFR